MTGSTRTEGETPAIPRPDGDRVPSAGPCFTGAGASGVQKSVPLKKIAAVDNLLSCLAGVSPGWRINLWTNDLRCFGQEFRGASERCPEAHDAAGKNNGRSSKADDLHSWAVR